MAAPANPTTSDKKTDTPRTKGEQQRSPNGKKPEHLREEEDLSSSEEEDEEDEEDDGDDDDSDLEEYDDDEDEDDDEDVEDDDLVNQAVIQGGQLVQDAPDQVGNVGKTTSNVGKAAKDAVEGVGGGSSNDKNKPLRLRLDLDLEVEVQLKARLHGDVTLSLLA